MRGRAAWRLDLACAAVAMGTVMAGTAEACVEVEIAMVRSAMDDSEVGAAAEAMEEATAAASAIGLAEREVVAMEEGGSALF